MVGCLLMNIPISLLFRQLSCGWLRKWVGLVVGLGVQWIVFRAMMLQIVGHSLVVYLLLRLLKHKASTPVFIYSFAFLLGQHYYSLVYKYKSWDLDITTVLMMYTLKYTALACQLSDGKGKVDQLSHYRQQQALDRVPGVVDYFSYIFCFLGCLAGPFYEYKHFHHFMESTHPLPLPSLLYFVYDLGLAIAFMATTALIAPMYPLSYVTTSTFANDPYVQRVIYLTISISLLRAKYYCGWLLIQTSLTVSGMCCDPATGNQRHVLTADPWLELDHTLKKKLELWNASTQVWLKNYVYFRLYTEEQIRNSPAKANISQYATFIISALWHGFYPSYYIGFVSTALLNQLAKYLFKSFTCYQHFLNKFYLFQNPLYIITRQ